MSRLLKACGNNVMKVTLVNDRGVHICKSMLAWLKVGNGETPQSSGKKGDHLVGDCYVAFNNIYKQEVDDLVAGGMSKEEAKMAGNFMNWCFLLGFSSIGLTTHLSDIKAAGLSGALIGFCVASVKAGLALLVVLCFLQ